MHLQADSSHEISSVYLLYAIGPFHKVLKQLIQDTGYNLGLSLLQRVNLLPLKKAVHLKNGRSMLFSAAL